MIGSTRNPFVQKLINLFWHLPKSIFYSVYYNFPAKKLKLIGITGTDGKTTSAILMHQVLTQAGYKTGLISTIGAKIDKNYITTGLHTTSPNPKTIQSLLSQMVKQGLTHAVVEVTSHSLDQYRFWGCDFEIGIFTNLTSEHQDYHRNMNSYLHSKAKLFAHTKHQVANADSPYFSLLQKITNKKFITFGINNNSDYQAKKINLTNKFLSFTVDEIFYKTDSNYYYQIYNILGVLASLSILKIDRKILQRVILQFPPTKGRREEVANALGIKTIVDFAHTPAALEQTLNSLRQTTSGKLIVLFGATGGRDKQKRPEMGRVSTDLANITIITSDDTRLENIQDINHQIISGISKNHLFLSINDDRQTKNALIKNQHIYFNVPDRQEAFNLAIHLASKGDTVIACGKGHETTILHGKTEYPWSETDAFKTAFTNNKSPTRAKLN